MLNTYFIQGVYFPLNPFDEVHKKPDPKELDNLVRTGKWLYLSKRDFEEILESDCGELKVQHSLTEAHIDIRHSKTNVRVAAQTFSTKTAAAMEFLTPHKKPKAEAVRVVNNVSILFCKIRILLLLIQFIHSCFYQPLCPQSICCSVFFLFSLGSSN